MTAPLPSVRVLWRPEQFTRVSNGTFDTNATGWLATAGINAAGTSITRITTDSHSGAGCGKIICTSTSGSGANFDMGTDRFFDEADYGAMYIATLWLKRFSGSTRAEVILGSLGTSTDRATLTITDLTDSWQPYTIRWLPGSSRTDVELAITNGSAEAVTILVDDVVVYQVDAFSQVENGTFEVDTTGWSAANGGAIARSTSSPFGGSACARVTSSAAAFSGVTYSFGGRRFVSGRTYRLQVAAMTISGTGDWSLEWKSTASGVLASTTITPTGSWVWYTVDWTAGSTFTDMFLFIHHSSSVAVMAIDEVEAYERYDDLGTDAGDISWDRSFEGVGGITVQVENADGLYDPLNSAGALYGAADAGKRIWGRATYSGALYALFYGTIRTIEAQPWGGIHATIVGEDIIGDLSRATCYSDFAQDDWYAKIRSWVHDSFVSGVPAIDVSPSSSARENLSAVGIEGNTFYRGTDGDVGILDLLNQFNEATQSVHWIAPSVHANIGYQLTTIDRATLTDTSSDFTVSESDPPADLTGIRRTREGMENQQYIPWQAYTILAPEAANDAGFGYVIAARDPSVAAYDVDGNDPYLHYLRDEYGTDDDHPDVRWRYGGIGEKKWRKRREKGKKVPRRTKVHNDPFVPFTMAAGDVQEHVLDFAIPMSGPVLSIDGPSGVANVTIDYVEVRPHRIIVRLSAMARTTIDFFAVAATPWLPGDDKTQLSDNFESQAKYAIQTGPVLSTPYIPDPGSARGVGTYRNWRYGNPRLRPTLVDHNDFPRTLTADLGDHWTVTLDRWRLSAVLFLATGCSWRVTQGGLDWYAEHQLEELPTHTTWFILDDAAKGLDDAVVLAY